MDILFDSIGIVGVATILYAYFMVQTERLSSQQLAFPILNLIGAILLLISLMRSWNTPSVIIEIAWISISIYGIYRILKERKDAEK